jgi:hypothetical protein
LKSISSLALGWSKHFGRLVHIGGNHGGVVIGGQQGAAFLEHRTRKLHIRGVTAHA